MAGPYRRVVRWDRFVGASGRSSYLYMLECGHEVRRGRKPHEVGRYGGPTAYCDFCITKRQERLERSRR